MFRTAFLAACLLLSTVLLPLRASTSPTSPSTSPGSALAEHMEGLKENLKGIAMALQGPDAERALRHVAEMQRIVLLAKLEIPPNLEEQPSADRDAHRVQFRKSLIAILQELAGMELDILDGEYEKALARIMGPLLQLRESSHERFKRAE